ncbi:MAG: hypothetical protein FWE74_03755 [Oscillospiraceae bacterium]|nr:hypothetical protein [Oscillospiraceae bacterium]
MKEILDELFIKAIRARKIDDSFMPRVRIIEKKLMETLDDKQRSLLIDYADAYNRFISRNTAENFKRGFWLGFEMMRELQESG